MYLDGPDRFPANYGDKIIVFGAVTQQFRPTVTDMEWIAKEARWRIYLTWESGGESRVYSSDRGKVWIPAEEYQQRVLH